MIYIRTGGGEVYNLNSIQNCIDWSIGRCVKVTAIVLMCGDARFIGVTSPSKPPPQIQQTINRLQ